MPETFVVNKGKDVVCAVIQGLSVIDNPCFGCPEADGGTQPNLFNHDNEGPDSIVLKSRTKQGNRVVTVCCRVESVELLNSDYTSRLIIDRSQA